ncbi:MAG: YggS family pyridoxal phosphate-dependent enzyme [Proteobacteria bacterium]|nr:YggS family pyridoxal phosphate-dependent enzyme [Pseudomonadota bacterium]
MNPQNLALRIESVRERIARASAQSGRSAQSVTLLAVSKGQDAQLVAQAADLGVRSFGESYLNEALGKLAALQERDLEWHFIGRIQANKTRAVAESFAWVHAVDRLRIAERLSAQRPFHAPPLNVCLQVNIAGEASKGGVAPGELGALAAAVATLPRLKLRGLMCLPPQEDSPERQRHWFHALAELRAGLNAGGAGLDTLSMGMSDDFEAAIAEGSTLVRLGTVLFGPRSVQ